MKACYMTGNRDAPQTLYPAICKAVHELAEAQGVALFITGGRGRFEHMAAQVVQEAKGSHPDIRLCFLLAYHPGQRSVQVPAGYDESLYPLEKSALPRIAIARVNRHMVDHCLACILYAALPGNSRKILDRARVRAARGQLLLIDLSEA